MASPGLIAVGAVGAALLLVTLVDLFVTIFNYDGFTFLAGRLHKLTWRVLRLTSAVMPAPLRRSYLSLGSAAMLPMTLAWWLALEVTAFALMYLPGLAGGGFMPRGAHRGIGSAYYVSGGAISTLGFEDVSPSSGLYRALVDLEAIVGIATFTLALAYVLAAFEALGTLHRLHGRVRRHAVEPNHPETIVARYYHGGQPGEISNLLAALTEDLEEYDQGLRRFPVVFYFHSRRPERSIPAIFAALGNLIELLRWGLPAGQLLVSEPYLLALADEYTVTVGRLERSFVGPSKAEPPRVLSEEDFHGHYSRPSPDDRGLAEFRQLQRVAIDASGLPESDADCYRRYGEWLEFRDRRTTFLRRVRDVLRYPQQGEALGAG